MALNALKAGNVAQVHWVLEGLVGFVAGLAFAISEATEIYRVCDQSCFHRTRRIRRVEQHRVADITVIGNHFAGVAYVLTIMTAKTA
jgi:hypothetical protein